MVAHRCQKLASLPSPHPLLDNDIKISRHLSITPNAILGMQVTVDIIGGKRTVMDYILTPIKRATDVAFREK